MMRVISQKVKNKNCVQEKNCFGKLFVNEKKKLNREFWEECKEETRLLNSSGSH
jgi:hypothetical protein